MSHVMIPSGIDHAYETCLFFQLERRAFPKDPVFIDPDTEWHLDPEYPHETRPFGLCGWCWRVYQARRNRRDQS